MNLLHKGHILDVILSMDTDFIATQLIEKLKILWKKIDLKNTKNVRDNQS